MIPIDIIIDVINNNVDTNNIDINTIDINIEMAPRQPLCEQRKLPINRARGAPINDEAGLREFASASGRDTLAGDPKYFFSEKRKRKNRFVVRK